LEKEKSMRVRLADGYDRMLAGMPLIDENYDYIMGGYSRNIDKAGQYDKVISDLKERRAQSVQDDPKFNTNDFINDQESLGNVPFGSKGIAKNNCCAAVAAHNMNLLLGEDSNFADVYTEFNDNSNMLMGDLAGGTWGVKPATLMKYFRKKGYKVSIGLASVKNLSEIGKYLYTYVWIKANKLGAHYIAMENTGKGINMYNPPQKKFSAEDIYNYLIKDKGMLTFTNGIIGEANLGFLIRID
ncbi:MAG: hypothetical protein ACOX8Q_10420, partial [Christensenellales bacterium]